MRVDVPISHAVSAIPRGYRNRRYAYAGTTVPFEVPDAPSDATEVVVGVDPRERDGDVRFLRVGSRLHADPWDTCAPPAGANPLAPTRDWSVPDYGAGVPCREQRRAIGGVGHGDGGLETLVAEYGSIRNYEEEGYETTVAAVGRTAARCVLRDGVVWGRPVCAGIVVAVDPYDVVRVRPDTWVEPDLFGVTDDFVLWFDPGRIDDARAVAGTLASVLGTAVDDTVTGVEGARAGTFDPILPSASALSVVGHLLGRRDWHVSAPVDVVRAWQEVRRDLSKGTIGAPEALGIMADAVVGRNVPRVLTAVVEAGAVSSAGAVPIPPLAGEVPKGLVAASTDLQVSLAAARHMLPPADEDALRASVLGREAVLLEGDQIWFVCDADGSRVLSRDPAVEAFRAPQRSSDHTGDTLGVLARLEAGGVRPTEHAATPFLDFV